MTVRTNMALNPRYAGGGVGGIAPNYPAVTELLFTDTLPVAHPRGITTGVRSHRTGTPIAGHEGIIMSVYSPDMLPGSRPARYCGAWALAVTPGLQVVSMGTSFWLDAPVPLPPGVWTWVTSAEGHPTDPAGGYAGFEVRTVNGAAPDPTTYVYMTGFLAEPEAHGPVGYWFDGSTPDVPPTLNREGAEYAWSGDPNRSESTATTLPVLPTTPLRMPVVTVRGNRISPEWSESAPVVLANLEHQWGRDGLYDPNEPGRLTVEVIDPDGHWVGDPAIFQAPITVETPLPSGLWVTFRGWIDQATIRPHDYARPDGQNGRGWIGRFTATDVIAALSKITTYGYEDPVPPGNQYSREHKRAKYGNGYWRLSGSNASRTSEINSRIAATGVPVTIAAPADPPLDAGHPNLAAGDDLYTRVVALYARDATFPADVRYYPHEQQIIPGHLARAGTLSLEYVAGVIIVQATPQSGGVAPITVPAADVIIDDGAPITAALSHNITSVRVHAYDITRGTEMFTGSDGTARAYAVEPQRDTPIDYPVPGALGYNQFDVPTEVNYASGDASYHENPWTFADRIITVVQRLNTRVYPPEIEFDLSRVAYPDAVITALLCGHGVDNAWNFPGALYEPVPGFGPFFQLIGATATYDSGWTVRGRFAPADPTGAAGNLPINQLVTIPAPQLAEFDPDISLTTLATVNEGVN